MKRPFSSDPETGATREARGALGRGPFRRGAVHARADQPGPDEPSGGCRVVIPPTSTQRRLHTLEYYNTDLNGARQQIASAPVKPPLAWSDALAAAALKQSQDEADSRPANPYGADGADLNTRLERAGFGNRISAAENTFAYAKSVDQAMQAFLIDWGVPAKGHFHNLLQPDRALKTFQSVGIGIVNTNKARYRVPRSSPKTSDARSTISPTCSASRSTTSTATTSTSRAKAGDVTFRPRTSRPASHAACQPGTPAATRSRSTPGSTR